MDGHAHIYDIWDDSDEARNETLSDNLWYSVDDHALHIQGPKAYWSH